MFKEPPLNRFTCPEHDDQYISSIRNQSFFKKILFCPKCIEKEPPHIREQLIESNEFLEQLIDQKMRLSQISEFCEPPQSTLDTYNDFTKQIKKFTEYINEQKLFAQGLIKHIQTEILKILKQYEEKALQELDLQLTFFKGHFKNFKSKVERYVDLENKSNNVNEQNQMVAKKAKNNKLDQFEVRDSIINELDFAISFQDLEIRTREQINFMNENNKIFNQKQKLKQINNSGEISLKQIEEQVKELNKSLANTIISDIEGYRKKIDTMVSHYPQLKLFQDQKFEDSLEGFKQSFDWMFSKLLLVNNNLNPKLNNSIDTLILTPTQVNQVKRRLNTILKDGTIYNIDKLLVAKDALDLVQVHTGVNKIYRTLVIIKCVDNTIVCLYRNNHPDSEAKLDRLAKTEPNEDAKEAFEQLMPNKNIKQVFNGCFIIEQDNEIFEAVELVNNKIDHYTFSNNLSIMKMDSPLVEQVLQKNKEIEERQKGNILGLLFASVKNPKTQKGTVLQYKPIQVVELFEVRIE